LENKKEYEQSLFNTKQFCEKLRKTIEIETGKNPVIPKFTCSFGVIDLLECENIKDGIEKDDILLYTAKKQGRNRIVIYND
jgi:GGDEF domain-containing protein